MKHWYVTGPEQIELIEEPVPVPGSGEVLVRTAFTALSPGSNVHVYKSGTYQMDGRPPRTEALYMASGVVEAIGPDVHDRAVGDRVAMSGSGHQEFAILPVNRTFLVPEALSLQDASIAYLASWSVSALHLGNYVAAETVVVMGLGLVGASAAIVADSMGARVLGIDAAQERVDFASRFDLGCVQLSAAPDAEERIAAFVEPNGPDLIIETTGSWAGLKHAIALARDYTRIAIMGIYRQPPPPELGRELFLQAFDYPSKFHYGRLQIIGCGSDPGEISEPMPRMATRAGNFNYTLEQAARGRLPIGKLVTTVTPAHEIEPIIKRFAEGDRSMVGVVFDWAGI